MVFPIVAPPDPQGIMMLTILNLHYIRKLSCKYDLFYLSGSVEEDFLINPPIFTSQGLVIRNLAQTLDNSQHSKSRLEYD